MTKKPPMKVHFVESEIPADELPNYPMDNVEEGYEYDPANDFDKEDAKELVE